jgi:hypothetical protein
MTLRTALFALPLVLSLFGCRIPVDAQSPTGRGARDPGASSFAFFGGLKAFFVDEPAPTNTRTVSEADLTRVDTPSVAPVRTETVTTSTRGPSIR